MSESETIGHYRIDSLLGSGGMGEVYRATDPRLFDRPVAIKVLAHDLLKDTSARRRFEAEIRELSRLRHRNIVTIFDWGEHDGRPYFVMEFLDGVDLAQLIDTPEAWTIEQQLEIAIEIADALAAAHANGIVHRDVKPGNIVMVSEGGQRRPILLDFGIVRRPDSDITLMQTQPGTLRYMSPEQITDVLPPGPASDLFSLGVVFYEMFTGVHPFEGGSEVVVSSRIVYHVAEAPRTRNKQLPASLSDLISRMLEKEAERRPNSAEAVAAELREIHRGCISDRAITDPSEFENLDDITRQYVEGLVRWARQREADGALSEAVSAFEKAFNAAPEVAWIQRKLSELRHQASAQRKTDNLVRQAREALDSGRVTDARRAWHLAWLVTPHNPDVEEIERQLKRNESSRKTETPATGDDGLESVREEMRQGRLGEARHRLVALIKEDAGDARPRELLERIIRIHRHDIPYADYAAEIGRGWAELRAGSFDSARAHVERALELWPGDVEAQELQDGLDARVTELDRTLAQAESRLTEASAVGAEASAALDAVNQADELLTQARAIASEDERLPPLRARASSLRERLLERHQRRQRLNEGLARVHSILDESEKLIEGDDDAFSRARGLVEEADRELAKVLAGESRFEQPRAELDRLEKIGERLRVEEERRRLERQDAERRAREREAAERKAREEAARREQERATAERRAREQAERREREREEAERKVREQARQDRPVADGEPRRQAAPVSRSGELESAKQEARAALGDADAETEPGIERLVLGRCRAARVALKAVIEEGAGDSDAGVLLERLDRHVERLLRRRREAKQAPRSDDGKRTRTRKKPETPDHSGETAEARLEEARRWADDGNPRKALAVLDELRRASGGKSHPWKLRSEIAALRRASEEAVRRSRMRQALIVVAAAAGIVLVIVLLLIVTGCAGSSPARSTAASDTSVDLVLLLVVDQLPQRYWSGLMPRFSAEGFGRLAREGRSYTAAHWDHGTTLTATGHAGIVTGLLPSRHGIIANDWTDRATGLPVYSVGTREQPTPDTLLVPTVGDLLVEHNGASRVFAVSIKDRAAVILAGRRGTALWYDTSGGRFRVRTPEGVEPAEWTRAWVSPEASELPGDLYGSEEWSLLQEESSYRGWCAGPEFGCPDPEAAVRSRAGDAGSFPKSLPRGSGRHKRIRATPQGDRMTLEAALEALREERLGLNEAGVPDLLAISFSATDYVGHRYGPDTIEYEDNLLHLDALVAGLLDAVDRQVGLDRTLVLLTSDHGTDSATVYHEHLGRPTGQLLGRLMVPRVNAALRDRYGYGVDLVAGFYTPGLFLDPQALAALGLDRGVVADQVAEIVGEMPGAGTVYVWGPEEPVRRGGESRWYDELVARTFHPQRSGDVIVVPAAHVYLGRQGDDVAMHGTPYPYDTHVPLLVMGPGVAAGTVTERVTPRQVAPTLGQFVGLEMDAELPPALR